MKINFLEIKTKSNLLSLIRLLSAIPLWILLDNFNGYNVRIITAVLCIAAAATDSLDGYLARKYKEVTELGKIIDPLADKVVVGAVIIKLFIIGEIAPYYLILILSRDLVIFIGGVFVSNKLGKVLPSNVLGKITVSNIGIIILLIILQVDKANIFFMFLYYMSIVLMALSLIAYIIRALEFLKQKEYGNI